MDPWSKVDYLRLIREALMVVETLSEINPPSGRVARQVRLAIPILESWHRRNSGEYRETECLLGFFGTGVNIGRRGNQGRSTPPCGLLVRPRVGPRHLAARRGVGPPLGPLRASGVLWN